MTEAEKRETNNIQERKRRSLGCAFWAAILGLGSSIFIVVFSGIIYSWQLGRRILRLDEFMGEFLLTSAVVLVIAIPIAAAIGYFTKTPKDKRAIFTAFPMIFIGLSLSFYWFVHEMCLFGETGHGCPRLDETPFSFIVALIIGFFLGLVGGYGYWRAGRHSNINK